MPHSRDGRIMLDPPCAQGHKLQAMECPDCSERITGKPAGDDWRKWYQTRKRKKPRAGT